MLGRQPSNETGILNAKTGDGSRPAPPLGRLGKRTVFVEWIKASMSASVNYERLVIVNVVGDPCTDGADLKVALN